MLKPLIKPEANVRLYLIILIMKEVHVDRAEQPVLFLLLAVNVSADRRCCARLLKFRGARSAQPEPTVWGETAWLWAVKCWVSGSTCMYTYLYVEGNADEDVPTYGDYDSQEIHL